MKRVIIEFDSNKYWNIWTGGQSDQSVIDRIAMITRCGPNGRVFIEDTENGVVVPSPLFSETPGDL